MILAAIGTAIGLIVSGRTVVPVVSETLFPIHYQEEIADVADRYDLDPYLVAAVAKTESGFDPEAVSPVGAVGMMQLMPPTAEWITTLDLWQGDSRPELTDAGDSLELGACYLAYLYRRFGEDNRTAVLAAYNAGPNAVEGWIESAGGADSFGSADIRYPETRDFVERVQRFRFIYGRVHPDMFSSAAAVTATGVAA